MAVAAISEKSLSFEWLTPTRPIRSNPIREIRDSITVSFPLTLSPPKTPR
jgi:hypothetical protein